MNQESLIDEILNHFSSGPFASEVLGAKKQFYDLAGVFDEESTEFEQKMTQFIDWYLFTRPLQSTGLTPVNMVVQSKGDFFSSQFTLQDIEHLSHSRHSMFEFLKLKNSDVYIRDLFAGEKLVIKNSVVTVGFEKDQFFESRLIPDGDSFVFSASFCFHPPKASRYILKEIKRVRKIKDVEERNREQEALLIKLFRMRYKFDQYKHVDLHEIYTNKPRLKI